MDEQQLDGLLIFGYISIALCCALYYSYKACRASKTKNKQPKRLRYFGQSSNGVWDAEVYLEWDDGRRTVMWHDTFTSECNAASAAVDHKTMLRSKLNSDEFEDEFCTDYNPAYEVHATYSPRDPSQAYYRIELYRLPG